MVEWIKNNKEWLFSGAGIAAFTFLSFFIRFLFKKFRPSPNKKSDTDKNLFKTPKIKNPEEITEKDKNTEQLTLPSPNDIINHLDSSPPFQKKDIAKHYTGIRVRWLTFLYSAYERGKDETFLTLSATNRAGYPWIYCSVNINDYPELKISPEGTKIIISGQIEQVFMLSHEIKLENVNLKIIK